MHKKNSVSAQQNPLELEVTNFLAVRENLRSVPEKRQYLGRSRLALVRSGKHSGRARVCVCVCACVRACVRFAGIYLLNTTNLAIPVHHIS